MPPPEEDCVTIVTAVAGCVTIATTVADCVTIATTVADCATIVANWFVGPLRLMVRTSPFQGKDTGSIPVGDIFFIPTTPHCQSLMWHSGRISLVAAVNSQSLVIGWIATPPFFVICAPPMQGVPLLLLNGEREGLSLVRSRECKAIYLATIVTQSFPFLRKVDTTGCCCISDQ